MCRLADMQAGIELKEGHKSNFSHFYWINGGSGHIV